MFTSEKIEEWIKEVEQRPASAALIIQFIANRLRDLNEWNESLRAENLSLRTGARVEEYERQIAHLEYQLDLLKRQFGGQLPASPLPAEIEQPAETFNLLMYDTLGRVLRLELEPDSLSDGTGIGMLRGDFSSEDSPRLLVVPAREELMFIFASGRIASLPVAAIPKSQADDIHWEQASIPHEPQARDSLACLSPISKIALADFFVQISRRGYLKKIRKALAASIMENHYIGTGVKRAADQTLDLALGNQGNRFILVSWEGYLQSISEELLPYAIVEAMRLGKTDHLVAAFTAEPDQTILVMTQVGKVIQRVGESIEPAADLQRKGQMLYATARRDQGVRVVGAGAVNLNDWGVALHADGKITLHAIENLLGRGAIQSESEILVFAAFC